MSNDVTETGGNRGGNQRQTKKNYRPGPKKTVEILPDPEVLEAYDYIVEGSAQDILDMFKAEQKHRHQWENRSLKVHLFSTILGQILGFCIAIAIFVSASVIGMYGDASVGAFIWIFGLAIVAMSALVWWYAKSMGQRPLFARPALRASYRPEKD
tara:strand:- start:326 stop:790 length:465 start_codon:yes stop_codon:yes gene_type:complete